MFSVSRLFIFIVILVVSVCGGSRCGLCVGCLIKC